MRGEGEESLSWLPEQQISRRCQVYGPPEAQQKIRKIIDVWAPAWHWAHGLMPCPMGSWALPTGPWAVYMGVLWALFHSYLSGVAVLCDLGKSFSNISQHESVDESLEGKCG